jgi:type VI secretion system protein ImpM
MTNLQGQPGFYGKFPLLGDFISRRLPAEFIQVWDGWLQRSLLASRERLGDGWLSIYLTSPIWRFILSPGICGQSGWMGVMMPSVDRVGRYFPLTLATAINEENGLAGLFLSAADWFDRLEHLALSSLEDGFNLDTFDTQLQQEFFSAQRDIQTPLTMEQNCANGRNPLALHIEMHNLALMPEAITHLSSCLLPRLMRSYSLWSSSGSERVQPCLLVFEELPPETAFAELLNGQWQIADRQGKISLPASSGIIAPTVQVAAPKFWLNADREGPAPLQWSSAVATSVGKVRKINEDSYLDHPAAGLWAVADGMGGHFAGEVASKAVVEALANCSATTDLQDAVSRVIACLHSVNAQLIAMSGEGDSVKTMGSTVVAMLASGNQGAAIWAGDSRLYRLRGELLTQLTEDHSLAVELARQGTPVGQINSEPVNSNIITRAVGAQPELAMDSFTFQVEDNDIYLLCSDGLIREVKDDEIGAVLRRHDQAEAVQALVELALERGARDNVTVIVVRPAPAGKGV